MSEDFLEHLDSMCPKLKCFRVDMSPISGESLELPLAVYLYHDTLEKMTISTVLRAGVRLSCLQLTSLRLDCDAVAMDLPNLEAN